MPGTPNGRDTEWRASTQPFSQGLLPGEEAGPEPVRQQARGHTHFLVSSLAFVFSFVNRVGNPHPAHLSG